MSFVLKSHRQKRDKIMYIVEFSLRKYVSVPDKEDPSLKMQNVEDEEELEEAIEDNEELGSQVWDELGRIALEQAQRAASRWDWRAGLQSWRRTRRGPFRCLGEICKHIELNKTKFQAYNELFVQTNKVDEVDIFN
ncbi:hypothetical protein CBR_g48520 [Chara braunii]|uniref:Uncharacterized protein n=1 Tax=Chara braunii TaxID=69332 RepID=A0A388M2U6_CHABU|nr:hypothetical protein CBR_g48520 [Chara braunii]|eukprot:GBG88908.1 hypothetical protein CBR_g48520 [Chara braunii]